MADFFPTADKCCHPFSHITVYSPHVTVQEQHTLACQNHTPARVSAPAVQRWVLAGARFQPGAGSSPARPERVTGAAPGSRLPPRNTATPSPPRWRRDRKTTFPSAPFLSSPGVLYTSARSVPPGGTAGPAGSCSPAKALRAVPVGGERAAEPPGRAGNKA